MATDDAFRTEAGTGWPRRPRPEIAERLRRDGIDYILAQWVDIHGTPRVKGVPASALSSRSSAARRASPAPRPSAWARGRTATTWSACPTSTRTPWCRGRPAWPGSRCDITVDGEAWPYCSRTVLKRGDRAPGGHRLRDARSASRPSTCSITPRRRWLDRAVRPAGVRHAREALLRLQGPVGEPAATCATLIRAMEGLGWEPYASDHEDGTAQFELNWKYADALTTADRYTFFKMMTNQVAREATARSRRTCPSRSAA